MLHRWPSLNRLAEVWEPAADPDNIGVFKTVLEGARPDDTALVGYFVGRLCRDDGGGILALPPNPFEPHEPEHEVWRLAFANGQTVEDRHCLPVAA